MDLEGSMETQDLDVIPQLIKEMVDKVSSSTILDLKVEADEEKCTNAMLYPSVIEIIQRLCPFEDLLRSRLVCFEWNKMFEITRINEYKKRFVTLISQDDVRNFNNVFNGSFSQPFRNFEMSSHLMSPHFLQTNNGQNPMNNFITTFSPSIHSIKVMISEQFSDLSNFFMNGQFPNLDTLSICDWTNSGNSFSYEDLIIMDQNGLAHRLFESINMVLVDQLNYIEKPKLPSLTEIIFDDLLTVNDLQIFNFFKRMAPKMNSVCFPSSYIALEDIHRDFFDAFSSCKNVEFSILKFGEITDITVKCLELWSRNKNLILKGFSFGKLSFKDPNWSLDHFIAFLLLQRRTLKVLEIGSQRRWPEVMLKISQDSDDEDEEEESESEMIDENEVEDANVPEDNEGEEEMEIVEQVEEVEVNEEVEFAEEVLINEEYKLNFFEQFPFSFPLVERLALKSSSTLLTTEHFLRNKQWPNLHEIDFSFSSDMENLKGFIDASEEFNLVQKLTLSYDGDNPVSNFFKPFKLKFASITTFIFHIRASKHERFDILYEIWTLWPATLQHLTLHLSSNSMHWWPCEDFLTGINGLEKFLSVGNNRFITLDRKPSVCKNKELTSFSLFGRAFMGDEVANLCFFGMEKLKKLSYSSRYPCPYQFSHEVVARLGQRGIAIKAINE